MTRIIKFILFIAILSLCACTTSKPEAYTIEKEKIIYLEAPEKGDANYVWEAPIVDVVTVPPGLDPEGIYYRPVHEEVVEIRQGRWRKK